MKKNPAILSLIIIIASALVYNWSSICLILDLNGYGTWVKRAEEGDPLYQEMLGKAYYEGPNLGNLCCIQRDEKKGIELIEKAASQNDAYAFHDLSRIYGTVSGTYYNLEKSLEYLMKSAELGSRVAQNDLGEMYENGTHLHRDYKKAAKLYAQSADQKWPFGQINLAKLYLTGKGVLKDPQKAADLLKESLNPYPETEALFLLGSLYAKGEGVNKDKAKAREYLEKAVRKDPNYKPAQILLQSLLVKSK